MRGLPHLRFLVPHFFFSPQAKNNVRGEKKNVRPPFRRTWPIFFVVFFAAGEKVLAGSVSAWLKLLMGPLRLRLFFSQKFVLILQYFMYLAVFL